MIITIASKNEPTGSKYQYFSLNLIISLLNMISIANNKLMTELIAVQIKEEVLKNMKTGS